MHRSVVVTSALAAAFALASIAKAEYLRFDASLGTLPTVQGWDFLGDFNAPASAAAGTLTYGPTSVSGTTYWGHSPVAAVDFATQTVFIEATIRLKGCGFGNISGFRRGGFSLYLQDDAGRYIIADLGDNALSLGNDNNRTSDPFLAFDLTQTFHTVRLEAGPAGARLLVDGVEKLTLSLGTGAGGTAQGW